MFWNDFKKLSAKKEIPCIKGENGTKKRTNYKKTSIKRIKKNKRVICFVTAVLLCFICVGFALESIISDPSASKSDSIAMWLAKNQFVDMSGIDRYSHLDGYKPPQILEPSDNDISVLLPPTSSNGSNNEENNIYFYDASKIPEGETPIIPMDLSLYEYGNAYINNDTGLHPDTEELLNKEVILNKDIEEISATVGDYKKLQGPVVLIVHTHGTEAYVDNGAVSIDDRRSNTVFSKDKTKNVVSLGNVISEKLNNAGIYTLHYEIMHDETQYKDSYSRAEETIKNYLKKYPTIQLVIDIHRDSIVKNNGDYVKPLTLADGKKTAQVMCVVGSEWGGEECPSWKNNLSFALKLRKILNDKYKNLCRPPYLKASTYNQELSPYSMLIEIGSSANSYDEAFNAAEILGDELADMLKMFK